MAQGDIDLVNGLKLFSNISLVLHQMIHKSGREDFRVYLTGYPTFSDNRTASCDYTTFFYWHPSHHTIHLPGSWAYLFQELRLQLNNLITSLNRKPSQVTDSVNSAYQEQHVWFVDHNPFFDGYRFCGVAQNSEAIGGFGVNTYTEVIDPDSSLLDTWLFLSGWPDNSIPGTESAQHAKEEDLEAVIAGTSTVLPDPATCSSTLGRSTDWADRMLCDTAMAVAGSEHSGYYGPSDAAAILNAIFRHSRTRITVRLLCRGGHQRVRRRPFIQEPWGSRHTSLRSWMCGQSICDSLRMESSKRGVHTM